MRALIVGCGRIGGSIAKGMATDGHSVTVMDVEPDRFRRLPKIDSIQPVLGDGTLEEDLRLAGIEKSDIFVAVTKRDTRNALMAQIARHIFGVRRVVARINDPDRQQMYEELGLQAISSTTVTSQMILEAAQS